LDEFKARTRIIDPLGPDDRESIRNFLAPLGLELEDDVELSAVVDEGGAPIAVASLAGDVLKCVGVLPGRDGEGAAARAVSAVMAEAEAKGRKRLFVYTKPANRTIFEGLGFVMLAEVQALPAIARGAIARSDIARGDGARGDGVALLENDVHAFDSWVEGIRRTLPGGTAGGAVVVNCNPFTLGHRYLIERAAATCAAEGVSGGNGAGGGTLLVLVVAGDRSSFPGTVREALVRAGTSDLSNVVVASGASYCVSGATFPAYYLKRKSDAAELQAALDATLFATRIAPALGIRRRFVGTEPYCQVTSAYNRAMAAILPAHGIELVEIARLERDGAAVSASAVRAALRDGEMARVRTLVPPSTAAWLESPEAVDVLERIRTGDGRH
jgi:[citrate (pro-3S)-lyase] ligase